MRTVTALVTVLAIPALAVAQSVVPAHIVLKVGDVPSGAGGQAVITVNQPFTTRTGHVGFTGQLEKDEYLFFDDHLAWHEPFGPLEIFSNIQDTCGVGNGGKFVFCSFIDGGDLVIWDHNGSVIQQFDLAPGFDEHVIAFLGRPEMTPDGNEYFVASVADKKGDQISLLYRATPGFVTLVPVIVGGQSVDDVPLSRVHGITFFFQASDNNHFLINSVFLDTPEESDEAVVLQGGIDATMVLREGHPTGDGDNWRQFREVSVNNSGHWVAGARTSSLDNHEVLVHNGAPRVRNNMTVAGIDLDDDWNLEAVSINNQGEVAFAFASDFLEDHALFIGHGATLPGSATLLLRRNDLIDVNADGVGDWRVSAIDTGVSSAQGLDLDDSGFIFVKVELTTLDKQEQSFDAVIRLATGGGCPGDWNGDGVTNSTDVSDLVNDWFADQANGSTVADWNGDGLSNSTDVSDFINAWFGTTGAGCDV